MTIIRYLFFGINSFGYNVSNTISSVIGDKEKDPKRWKLCCIILIKFNYMSLFYIWF